MGGGELETAAVAAWAEALGCDLRLLGEPGAHMVPGGARLRGRNVVYMAEVRAVVVVYCPGRLRPRAAAVLASTPPGHLFTAGACAGIAGVDEAQILGPSWHGFTDAGHFTSAVPGAGRRLDRGDPLLAGLREACGEAEWAEGGFADPDGVMYGIEQDGRLAAAGNLTRFRGYPADVGLLTHPAARGRGLARQIAVQMIGDALPAAGILRYRALATNSPSLAIARSLGFAGVRAEPDRPAARLITVPRQPRNGRAAMLPPHRSTNPARHRKRPARPGSTRSRRLCELVPGQAPLWLVTSTRTRLAHGEGAGSPRVAGAVEVDQDRI